MKKIFIQAMKFFGLSGIGWLIDFTIFTVLTTLNTSEVLSNMISSMVAVTFVFYTSTKNTFSNQNSKISIKYKYIIYVIYQIIIILLASYIIGQLSQWLNSSNFGLISSYSKIVSKILVTPFTMITNFIFMKFLIEKI